MYSTEAWVLYRGDGSKQPGELRLETISFPALTDDEVLIEPIYGCWEANMSHAIERQPIDVCVARGEDKIVIGNGGLVRVLGCGAAVRNVREGELCVFLGALGFVDSFGYPEQVHGYDAPHTIGLLARRTKARATTLCPVPQPTRFAHEQWASFSVRYMTAWSNWNTAYGCFRTQMSAADVPAPHVWGWGGGSTFAELDLARRHGCEVAMLSGSDAHLAYIREAGIRALDHRQFPELLVDERRYASDPEYKQRYRASEDAFLELVRELTDGHGVSIFLDYIGSPVVRATLKAIRRQGVIATAGWKAGTLTPTHRAIECIHRRIHVHTHAFRRSDAPAATAYAEQHGWLPRVTGREYTWDEIPRLADDFAAGRTESYFPIFRVNPV